jgi:hypothetical protein
VRGTIRKYQPKSGKPTFAYSFVAGRDESGKRVQITRRGFARKADAQAALRAAIDEYQKAPATERAMPTFSEFFARWHKESIARNWERKSAERYLELGEKYAIKLFGDVPLDQLSTEQLTVDMNRLLDHGGKVTKQHPQGRPLAPKTVRHVAFLVQGCLEQACDWKILTENAMKKVPKPRTEKASEDRGSRRAGPSAGTDGGHETISADRAGGFDRHETRRDAGFGMD